MTDDLPRSCQWSLSNSNCSQARSKRSPAIFSATALIVSREEVVSTDLPTRHLINKATGSKVVNSGRKTAGVGQRKSFKVIVKRQCEVNPSKPPQLEPSCSTTQGEWAPTTVRLRISDEEGTEEIEQEAWAFQARHERSPMDEECAVDDEASRHLMFSHVDPPLCATLSREWRWSDKDRSRSPLAHNSNPPPKLRPELTEGRQEQQANSVQHEVVERSVILPSHSTLTISDTKKLPCPHQGCDSVLFSQTALRKHKKLHDPKTFSCLKCDKRFSEKAKLNRHEKVHSGERPFKCSYDNCGKAFTHAFNLASHVKLHSDEKPFSCSYCEKSFAKKGNLKAHIQYHNRQTARLERNEETENHQ